MGVLAAILYIALVGLSAHLIGEALPRRWFHFDRGLYRTRTWEGDGALYQRFGIQRWKDLLPDKSRVAPGAFKKQVRSVPTPASLERFLQETCVAECVHWVLMLFSPGVLLFLHGAGGIALMLLYGLSNIPFIMIQRYNRPRLARLYRRLTRQRPAPAQREAAIQPAGAI